MFKHLKSVLQKCDKCDFSAFYKPYLYSLSTHILMPKRFSVPNVAKVFLVSNYTNLISKDFIWNSRKKVKCNECGKQFSKYRLKRHMTLMHQERKFACHLCTYKAQTGNNLRLHINKSHLGIMEFPKYKCPHCDIDTTNLDWHIHSVHHKNII